MAAFDWSVLFSCTYCTLYPTSFSLQRGEKKTKDERFEKFSWKVHILQFLEQRDTVFIGAETEDRYSKLRKNISNKIRRLPGLLLESKTKTTWNDCVTLNLWIFAFIGILFYTGVAKATGQDEITPTIFPLDNETHNEYIMKMYDNDCECIEYNCGCCQHLQWNVVSMDGKLCVNASYLEKDYGFSLTITYNNFAIINETISARNPPPICFGENILNEVDVEVCLHMYDINIDKDNFRVCFEIYGKIMKLPITKLKLGCIQTELLDKMKYIENNLSKLFLKKDCHRPGKPEKVWEIEIGHRNQEKSGENVKTAAISKFAHNSLKLLLFQIIVIIFYI